VEEGVPPVGSANSLTQQLSNEYDPSRPNDYEVYRREKIELLKRKVSGPALISAVAYL